jgi:uncharacterized protein YodC (DUF2158 family)
MELKEDLNTGDIVYLKSGSPELKVITTAGLVEVEWITEEGEKGRGVFHRTSLQMGEGS